jgi:hypothetical protein
MDRPLDRRDTDNASTSGWTTNRRSLRSRRSVPPTLLLEVQELLYLTIEQ